MNRKNNKTFECEKCGHVQPKSKTNTSTNEQQQQIMNHSDIFKEIAKSKSLPIYVQLNHKGFWTTDSTGVHLPSSDEKCDRNSVMMCEKSLLYIYKLALRHLLLSMNVIEPSDIDPANLVPHVVVRKSNTDPFSKFKSIQGEKFLITQEDLSVKSDFIMIELDKKRDLHMTLIYCKGLGKKINLIEAFVNVIKLLNYKPELIPVYQSLHYFGTNEIEYWYDAGALYPNNILIPSNYIKPVKKALEFEVTSAGSIL